MARFHVNFDPNRTKDHAESPSEGGGPSDTITTVTPGETDESGSGPLLRVGHRALLAYLGGIVGLSAFIAVVAPIFPPLATGGILLGALLVAGWLVFVRRPSGNGLGHGQVKVLRTELDQTRRRYERLFSAVPCFICVLDREHNILEANDLYRREFGVTDRSRCYEVCKRRTSKCPDCVVDATFSDGFTRSNEEILISREGHRINVVVHTRPILDASGKIGAVMEVFTDVTEVKRLQRQLALTGRAVAGTAHRIKNILMGLEGGIFIVNDGLEEDNRDAIAEGWEMVERNVRRVTAIVKDLLFTAKEREPEFINDVCPQEILLEVRELYADRMVDEDIEICADVPLPHHRGIFDPDAIHSLLCNLVGNAIDACRFDPSEHKKDHRVGLRCRQNGHGDTIFEVEDNGEGIPEDLNRKVFHEFFSSKGTEGTGIGLLVVQKVAEEHGGTVTFTSNPGEGTVFVVTIPANPRSPSIQRATGDLPQLTVRSH